MLNEMSSILAGINSNSIVNRIRLARNAEYSGSFLLVEGISDKKLFKKFCKKDACKIYFCNGRVNLLGAITNLKKSESGGVLGIADRDFAELLEYPEYDGNVIFTDENDMEIMILCSDAFENVLREFGSQNKIKEFTETQGKQVRELVFESASFIGALRLLSQKKGWQLSFEGITYHFSNNKPFFLDESRMINQILQHSKRRGDLSENRILEKIKKLLEKFDEKKNLCCGHDCMVVLRGALRGKISSGNEFNKKDGVKTLESVLRLAYDYDCFKRTKVYSEIREWENLSRYEVLV